jgi:uncharacterized protein (DUF302 family)
MELKSFGFGSSGELALHFDEALERTKEVLARHGFGVQAEIQISNALKSKLGVDIPREVILGVCNPSLAYRAIQIEPEITVLLPCNVTVREAGKKTRIAAGDAQSLVGLTNNPRLKNIALDAEKQLMAAMAEL